MGTGKLTQERLVEYVDRASLACKGDFAEVGVYRGDTFQRLARLANARGRAAHAFDSFRGMADPGEHDGGTYERGRFDIGGKQAFVDLMSKAGLVLGLDYQAHEGYVPACFDGCDELTIAFAYVDLDHYEPTAMALEWLHGRMSKGGVILCDDYFDGESSGPSLAIYQFASKVLLHKRYMLLKLDNDQCVILC